MIRFVLVILLGLLGAVPVFSQTPDRNDLETLVNKQKEIETEAEKITKQQEKVGSEIDKLQTDLVQASAESRGFERAYAQVLGKISTLKQQEQIIKSRIYVDTDNLVDLLAVLQRMGKNPPPIYLVSTRSVVDTTHAAGMISIVSTDLNQRTSELKSELQALQALRLDINKNRSVLLENAHEIEKRLNVIKFTIAEKSRLSDELDRERKAKTKEVQELADKARNLRELIARFEERAAAITPRVKPRPGSEPDTSGPVPRLKPDKNQPPSVYVPANNQRFADARGSLPLPVIGRLAQSFGSKLENGGPSKGIVLKTQKNAQVVAPFGGRVEFSGAFSNDQVVILNVGRGYFIVLTGLGETFTKAGDSVLAGEPLGLMPDRAGLTPQLFMEFRKDRVSIDPKPWIGPALARAQ